MELVDSDTAKMRNKLESLIHEVPKPSGDAEVDEVQKLLRKVLSDLADKVIIAVRAGDSKAIKEINAKLEGVVEKLDKLDKV